MEKDSHPFSFIFLLKVPLREYLMYRLSIPLSPAHQHWKVFCLLCSVPSYQRQSPFLSHHFPDLWNAWNIEYLKKMSSSHDTSAVRPLPSNFSESLFLHPPLCPGNFGNCSGLLKYFVHFHSLLIPFMQKTFMRLKFQMYIQL